MCDENWQGRLIGPINSQSAMSKNPPVFFFSNKDPLETELYEYHTSKFAKESRLKASYVYMLLDERNVDVDTMLDFLNSDSSNTMMTAGEKPHQKTGKTIDEMRVQQSLGTRIERITDISGAGYEVHYSHGDICRVDAAGENVYASSVIRYICDPDIEVGKPDSIGFEMSDCRYFFEWRSRLACTQCSVDQVQRIEGECAGQTRSVFTIPKDNEICQIFPHFQQVNDGRQVRDITYYGHPNQNKAKVYSFKIENEIEPCDQYSELYSNDYFMRILKNVVFVLFCLATCCVGAMCSYFQLQRRYQKLEHKQAQHQSWLRRMRDLEKGELKNMFATKVKKMKKATHKLAKSGGGAIKSAVNKKLQKKRDAQLEAVNVDIDDIEVELEEF